MTNLKSIALFVLLVMSSVSAQINKPVPGDYTPTTPEKYTEGITNPEEGILNTELPKDAVFQDSTGKTIKLGDIFNGEKPALMCVMYFDCQSTCGPLMNGVYEKIKELNIKPGKDFNLVFISMEPEEGPELAGPKKAAYLKQYNYESGEGQYFLTTDKKNITAVTKALDFKFRMIEGISDYSHPTVTYFITPNAKISRFLTGFGYNQQDIKFSLLTAGEGKIGTLLDNILVRCYKFDPQNKKYVRNSMMLMSIAGALTLLSLGLFLGFLWYHDLKKKKSTT